jgi:hypothetical protein
VNINTHTVRNGLSNSEYQYACTPTTVDTNTHAGTGALGCVLKPAKNIPPDVGAACSTALRAWVLRVQACHEHPSGHGCCVSNCPPGMGAACSSLPRTSLRTWVLRVQACQEHPSGRGCCVFKPAKNIPPDVGAACSSLPRTSLRTWVLRVQAYHNAG